MNAQDSEEEFINTPKDFTPILTAKINSFLGDSSSDYVGDPPPTVKKPAPSKKKTDQSKSVAGTSIPPLTDGSNKVTKELHQSYEELCSYKLTDKELNQLACHLATAYGLKMHEWEHYLTTEISNESHEEFYKSMGGLSITYKDVDDQNHVLQDAINGITKLHNLKRMKYHHESGCSLVAADALLATCYRLRKQYLHYLLQDIPEKDSETYRTMYSMKGVSKKATIERSTYCQTMHRNKVRYMFATDPFIYQSCKEFGGFAYGQIKREDLVSDPPLQASNCWKPVSQMIKDDWLHDAPEYPVQEPVHQVEGPIVAEDVERHNHTMTVARRSHFVSNAHTSLLEKYCSEPGENDYTDYISDYFPSLGLDNIKLSNTELGMVYIPINSGTIDPIHVTNKHAQDDARRYKVDVYSILNKNLYPNLDNYTTKIQATSYFTGLETFGVFHHFPDYQFECCKVMSAHGVPACTDKRKVSHSIFCWL